MSLPSANASTIPAETVRVAQASFGTGSPLLRLRDECGALFVEAYFSDLYSWKGQTAVSPVILATVTVLQYAERLSDRQAALMVCSRIDWKYLLGEGCPMTPQPALAANARRPGPATKCI